MRRAGCNQTRERGHIQRGAFIADDTSFQFSSCSSSDGDLVRAGVRQLNPLNAIILLDLTGDAASGAGDGMRNFRYRVAKHRIAIISGQGLLPVTSGGMAGVGVTFFPAIFAITGPAARFVIAVF